MDASGNNASMDSNLVETPAQVHRVIAGVIILLTSIFGIIGNSLVVIAVIVSKKLRTTTNVFVVNLAVADLLTCLFLPFLSLSLFINEEPPLSNQLCGVAIGMVYNCLGCSLYTLSSIAINRLLIITKTKYTYSKLFNPQILTVWVILIWIMSFMITILPPILDVGKLGYDPDYHICGGLTSHYRTALYESILVLGLYPIPLLIIVICYLWLYFHIRFHSKKMRRSSTRSLKETSSTGHTPVEDKRNGNRTDDVTSPSSNKTFFPRITAGLTKKIRRSSNLHTQDSLELPTSPTEKSENGPVFSTTDQSENETQTLPHDKPHSSVDCKRQPTINGIRKTTRQKISRRQVEITKNLFYVVCAFALCLSPYFICFITNCKNYWVLYAATCIFVNSCINPAVYATKHPHFKKVFKCIATCEWKMIPEPADFLRSVSDIFK